MLKTLQTTGSYRGEFAHSVEQASPFFLHGQQGPPLVSQTANEPLKFSERDGV